MNRNQLKIIACISMVIDHIGYILFPDVQLLRLIGRTAMPIFAFFIGEGCFYTKDRKKYFLRIFILGLICQLFYIGESLINGSGDALYFNILLTFSCSVIVCSTFLSCRNNPTDKNKFLFLICIGVFFAVNFAFSFIKEKTGVNICFDYGFEGTVLPVFALIYKDEKRKKIMYSAGTVLFAYFTYGIGLYFLFALVPTVFICLYNGKAGKKKLNRFFYLFYPLHLAVIYGISLII